MNKKLSTITAGVMAAAVTTVSIAPAVFARPFQDNEIKVTGFSEAEGKVTYDVAHTLKNKDDTVSLTVEPNDDYVCENISAKYRYWDERYHYWGKNYTILDSSDCSKLDFSLPSKPVKPYFPDVTVAVNFARKVYKINVGVAEEGTGTAEANVSESISGELIELTAVPAEDHQFVEWTGDVEVVENAFEMPKSDVNLTAVFEKYAIIDGAESEWVKGSSDGLTITGNGYYADFESALVDGNTLGEENYSAEAGSTKATLKPEFLATLSEGEHRFEMKWNNGSAKTTFNIVAQKEDPTPTPKPDPEPEQPKVEKEPEVKETKKEVRTVAPDTGMASVAPLFAIAITLIVGGALVAKKANKA